MHLTIIVGFSAFALGIVLSHLGHKDELKKLENELSKTRSLSVEKLTNAYDHIKVLEDDNKLLTKEINHLRNEIHNRN